MEKKKDNARVRFQLPEITRPLSFGCWGYVTTCGTEGNLYGMLLARETLPDGIVYTSSETHYSVFKAAHYYRQEVEVIPQIASDCLRLPLIASNCL